MIINTSQFCLVKLNHFATKVFAFFCFYFHILDIENLQKVLSLSVLPLLFAVCKTDLCAAS